jgi:hypothetical protein
MKKYIAIVLMTMAFTSASVLAHTSLTSSTPSDNAMLMKSPETLALRFGAPVRLVSLEVVNANNEAVAFAFAPTMEASNTFSYELPPLLPSTYSASWTIMGDDGHKMKGDFSFMVHAMDKMKGMEKMKHKKDKEMDHSQHSGH